MGYDPFNLQEDWSSIVDCEGDPFSPAPLLNMGYNYDAIGNINVVRDDVKRAAERGDGAPVAVTINHHSAAGIERVRPDPVGKLGGAVRGTLG